MLRSKLGNMVTKGDQAAVPRWHLPHSRGTIPVMQDYRWLHFALLAAACAASINIFAKIGMKGIDPDVATSVRSVVQALFVVGFVTVLGSWSKIHQINSKLAIAMLICSGVAGGLSWIFAFRALKLADVSLVAPIDKLSMPLGILLAVLILHERPTLINWVGIFLISGGAYLATWPRPRAPEPREFEMAPVNPNAGVVGAVESTRKETKGRE
jgi:transporter family protein